MDYCDKHEVQGGLKPSQHIGMIGTYSIRWCTHSTHMYGMLVHTLHSYVRYVGAHTPLICTVCWCTHSTHMYVGAHTPLICTVCWCTHSTHMYGMLVHILHSYVCWCTHSTHMYVSTHTLLICVLVHTLHSYVR